MRYSYNILVNKSGEKVNFFRASLRFISVLCVILLQFIILSLLKFFARIFFISTSKAF